MRVRDMRPGFMLEHMFTRRHLAEYLDGELDAPRRDRLEDHAHRCPSCQRLMATLMEMLEVTRDRVGLILDSPIPAVSRHRGRSPKPIDRDPSDSPRGCAVNRL